MTNDQLDELERLGDHLEGQWEFESCGVCGTTNKRYGTIHERGEFCKSEIADHVYADDAKLVCAIRNAFPVLIVLARIGLAAVDFVDKDLMGDVAAEHDAIVTAEGKLFGLAQAYLARKDG